MCYPFPLSPSIAVCLAVLACASPCGADDDLAGARRGIEDTYRAGLAKLASEVVEQEDGASGLVAEIAAWLPPRTTGQIVLFDPMDCTGQIGADGDLSNRFGKLRIAHAEALFDLAQRAAEAGWPAMAMRLAVETIRENPNQSEARRVLGYEKVGDEWRTPYTQRKIKTGYVWHSRFGWIKAEQVTQYESGRRPRGSQWISIEDDARRHDSIEHGWVIRTEHFHVTTNAGLEEGVRLASKLETLHALWRQIFAGYYLGTSEVRQLFAGGRNARSPRKAHRVRYYRTRDEYNAALVRRQPKIAMTLGIYFGRQLQSHFFSGEDQHPATIFHEATHQLFQESRRVTRNVGALDNFWILEGVATYMESLSAHSFGRDSKYYTLGGANAGRLPAARERLLEDGYYIPLAEVVRLGKNDLQRRSDLAKLYSQFAGLTAFFIHTDDGRYREALVEYLLAVYSGRADANKLSDATGKPYAELDREYREWLEALR